MIRVSFYVAAGLFLVCSQVACVSVPKAHFGQSIPTAPDYRNLENWAALPQRADSADEVPIPEWQDVQRHAAVDVFFIHPTTYIGNAKKEEWNASLEDLKLNLKTDQYPIRYQASIFNGAGSIYAPRYRQAHLHCFFSGQHEDAEKALELAYQDIRTAFEYYLAQFNQGRPFIIAGHSQGTYHAKRIITDYIDGKPLQARLIVAYLPGITVPEDLYTFIHPCRTPDDTGCFCSWRTFKEGYIPPKLHFPDTNLVVTNPVTWNVDIPESRQEEQLGGVLRKFNTLYPKLVSTRIYDDLLWVSKPRFPGSFLFNRKNYHIGDYNFFYADVRKNAQDRVRSFLAKQ